MIGEILTITPIATWTAAQIQERRQQLERVVKTEAATTTDLFKAVQDALPGSQRALSLRNWSRAEMIALITLLVNVMQCYLDHRH